MLRKYLADPSHVIDWNDPGINEDATFKEGPVEITDRKEKILREKAIPLVKVLWRHRGIEEST